MLPEIDACMQSRLSGLDYETGEKKEGLTWYPTDLRKFNEHTITVKEWTDCIPDLLNLKQETVKEPEFTTMKIGNEYDLQKFIEENVFKNITKCNNEIAYERKGGYYEDNNGIRHGYPDFMTYPRDSIFFESCEVIIEVKTFWLLTNVNLVEEWIKHGEETQKHMSMENPPEFRSEIQVIVQLVDYMYYEKVKYSIITTYKFWWFCMMEIDKDEKILWISNPVSYKEADILNLVNDFVSVAYKTQEPVYTHKRRKVSTS